MPTLFCQEETPVPASTVDSNPKIVTNLQGWKCIGVSSCGGRSSAPLLFTVLLNSDPQKKKLLHPKSIPTSQCYYCTLIFNNFEMFRKKLFEIKPQTRGGKCLKMGQKFEKMWLNFFGGLRYVKK